MCVVEKQRAPMCGGALWATNYIRVLRIPTITSRKDGIIG